MTNGKYTEIQNAQKSLLLVSHTGVLLRSWEMLQLNTQSNFKMWKRFDKTYS